MDVIDSLLFEIRIFFLRYKYKFEENHTLEHSLKVLNHVEKSLKYEDSISPEQGLYLKCAALLHDVDDKKFFPSHENYENAKTLLQIIKKNIDIDTVIQIIDYVSFSKNGNNPIPPENRWMLLVRQCDRLESIGNCGILRAYSYSLFINRPLYLDSTPKPQTLEEVKSFVLSKERYDKYLIKRCSDSMMDHFFDKVLYVCEDLSSSQNAYILNEAIVRSNITYNFVLKFAKNPSSILKNEILNLCNNEK